MMSMRSSTLASLDVLRATIADAIPLDGGAVFGSRLSIALLLAAAVLAASARQLSRIARTAAAQRPHAWRTAALLVLQASSAMLLYALLFPPDAARDAGTLTVLTADAGHARDAQPSTSARRVALPEAPATRDAERVADLATALRRWPGTARLRVVGAGLTARDREAVRGLALQFVPSPLPRGLVALAAPGRVQAGRRFSVHGGANALAGGSAELIAPDGTVVDRAVLARASLPAPRQAGGSTATTPPQDGIAMFSLTAIARSAGLATWRVRLRDSARREIETVEVPLRIDAGAAPRVLMLAGAPNAELKYLRRWATDAGLRLDTRIGLGGGLQIGDAPVAFDATALAGVDLLVLDQRAWQSLTEAKRTALDQAVRGGLGLLLRLDEPLSPAERPQLRRLGFSTDASTLPTAVRLSPVRAISPAGGDRANPDATAGSAPDGGAGADAAATDSTAATTAASVDPLPAISRGPMRIVATDATVALRDADAVPLALWRAQGRGRIGVAAFGDSYRLVLAGHAADYGQLWGPLFETLARAARAPDARIDADPRVGQRIVVCGIGDAATVEGPPSFGAANPAATPVPLRIDPRTGARRCAADWPQTAGWHRLRDGDRDQLFHVRAPDAAPGLLAAATREATLALAGDAPATTAATPTPAPGPRWPWLLGWLAASAGLWWLERSRIGRVRVP